MSYALRVLILAVVLGPWLGTLHQIVHAHAPGESVRELGSFKGLFGEHGSQDDCAAYDQLCHGDALLRVTSVPLAAPCPAGPASPAPKPWAQVPAPAFLARAPPARFV